MTETTPGKVCAFHGCPEPRYARGWCNKHYLRWRRHGNPAITLNPEYQRVTGATLEERFWAKVDKGDGTGCWLWTGPRNRHGYGTYRLGGAGSTRTGVHRLAYELLVGPIPEGLTLDHVRANGCTSRACVKATADEHGPAHLEPVTQSENNWRGVRSTRMRCKHGHPYNEANTHITSEGYRKCRACHREQELKRWRARKENRL